MGGKGWHASEYRLFVALIYSPSIVEMTSWSVKAPLTPGSPTVIRRLCQTRMSFGDRNAAPLC
jgi:hypothetical protein